MYNGIGLQTARGSGTNGYIQNNKFFIRPKTNKLPTESKAFNSDGVSKIANKDLLEHDRKRQVQLKLVVLEDKLIDQGFTDSEIAIQLDVARPKLEDAHAAAESDGPTAAVLYDKRVSDTQTHQIAARKEKQMEAFKAALGIDSAGKNQKMLGNHPDHGESNDDENLENIRKNGKNASDKVLLGDTIDEHDDIEKGVKDKKNEVRKDGIRSSKLQKNDSSDIDSSRELVKSRKKHDKIQDSHYRDESSSDSDSGGGNEKRKRKKP